MSNSVISSFPSKILQRDVAYELTGHWGYPVLLFPTSNGHFLQNRDFGLNEAAHWFTDHGKVKLYNIETFDADNIYNHDISVNERLKEYDLYQQFLKEEFIPFLLEENETEMIATGGCSFGGYHAANVGFRYPDLVSHIFSMSGAFDLRELLPDANKELIYFHSPEEFIPNDDASKYMHQNIILGTTDRDILLPENANMHHILEKKGIPHWYDERKWADHDWPVWRDMFPEYLAKFFM